MIKVNVPKIDKDYVIKYFKGVKMKTYIKRYLSKCSRFLFQFNKVKYPEVAEKLNSVRNKTQYILQLIQNDIKK